MIQFNRFNATPRTITHQPNPATSRSGLIFVEIFTPRTTDGGGEETHRSGFRKVISKQG